MASAVRLSGLTRRFPGNAQPALSSLDLSVAAGEIVCLVGPSGCGKSTTLRLVAGLDSPDSGSIRIGERDVGGVAPQDRDVAMVFQGFALYPHMRVRDILAFPLRMRKVTRPERARIVEQTAELLSITSLLDRRPGQLSGGEQQRVAMGRAIVRRPEVFLFDEPLSNLDAALRAELRVELGKLLRRLQVTALYVTHDQAEAMTLGDRIAVLNAGRLEQVDTPRRIYEQPASMFVASFFGTPPMNLLAVERVAGQARVGSLVLPAPDSAAERLSVGIRPEHLALIRSDSDPTPGPRIRGTVVSVEPHGAETHLELEAEGLELRTRLVGFDAPALGQPATLAIDTVRLHWFDRSTGRAL
jgi:multiple sugar transport system ATP-binding protein